MKKIALIIVLGLSVPQLYGSLGDIEAGFNNEKKDTKSSFSLTMKERMPVVAVLTLMGCVCTGSALLLALQVAAVQYYKE